VVDDGGFTVGLRRGDGEREGVKYLGGKWVLGTKNGYRRRIALFQNQIFVFFFLNEKNIY
jgi:hypothetical protein